MTTIIALIAWAFGIYGFIKLVTLAAEWFDVRESEWFVRLLAALPMILGAVTGVFAVRAAAEQVGLDAFVATLAADGLPLWLAANLTYVIVGTGAGSVAGQCYKVVKQTIMGADFRIQQD